MTARRRRRKRRNLRPRESKEPSVSDELKDDLPPKTKFRCLIWFVFLGSFNRISNVNLELP